MLSPEDSPLAGGNDLQTGSSKKPQAARIQRNFAEFESYVVQAQDYHARGELAASAAYAAIAAHVATTTHCGVFASPRLERLLRSIGKQIGERSPPRARSKGPLKRVLHVCTQMTSIGGHSKMVVLWMRADSSRTHSLVLTPHRGEIPANVAA